MGQICLQDWPGTIEMENTTQITPHLLKIRINQYYE